MQNQSQYELLMIFKWKPTCFYHCFLPNNGEDRFFCRLLPNNKTKKQMKVKKTVSNKTTRLLLRRKGFSQYETPSSPYFFKVSCVFDSLQWKQRILHEWEIFSSLSIRVHFSFITTFAWFKFCAVIFLLSCLAFVGNCPTYQNARLRTRWHR